MLVKHDSLMAGTASLSRSQMRENIVSPCIGLVQDEHEQCDVMAQKYSTSND